MNEEKSNCGNLKIFFGYAAGVGKTYAMLEAAHEEQRNGKNVVIGYVEPHTRPDTTALIAGLKSIPPKKVSFGSATFQEFDIDMALALKPQLILVDELAHTNAAGCRHTKRYQDVEELINAGISVYTTVNVQHLESLNDQVSAITGITVRERIPDYIFDKADQVELVDIEPENLILRLREGKIYKQQQAGRALSNFFSIENLTALREIALRRCADRVNRISAKVANKREGYYTNEHILVCLSSSPSNPSIIRTAARLAAAFHGQFTALYVENTPRHLLSEANRQRLEKNTQLARQLGAVIETTYGEDIAEAIIEYAKQFRISKIVMGRSGTNYKRLKLKPSLVDKITAAAGNLDVYIIPDRTISQKGKTKGIKTKLLSQWKLKSGIYDVAITIGTTTVATLISFFFYQHGLTDVNIVTIYIFGILINSLLTQGPVSSFISSVLSVLTFNFFFTEPRFTLDAYDVQYPITFFIMFLSGFFTSTLAKKLKVQLKKAGEVAYRTSLLFEINKKLQKAESEDQIFEITAEQLKKLLSKNIVYYSVHKEKLGTPHVYTEPNSPEDSNLTARLTSANEQAVAHWVALNNASAGATTDTLSQASCLYYAIRSGSGINGVIGIEMKNSSAPIGFEYNLIMSMLGEAGFALERYAVMQEREEARALAKNEQLKANILRAISHDLRTPLASISGNADLLAYNHGNVLSEEKKYELALSIHEEALYLINLVENLLSVSRIEDGKIKLNQTPELIDEVIEEAVSHVRSRLKQATIEITPFETILMAKIDARLIVQVIINLVDNGIKYSPNQATISISAKKSGAWIQIEVADQGQGIPDSEKSKIFDMFYTGHNQISDSRRSLGIGLALCKSIIDAHGGKIFVKDNHPQGSIFVFTLPAQEVSVYE